MLYFQEPGVAEAEFSANPTRTFNFLFQSAAAAEKKLALEADNEDGNMATPSENRESDKDAPVVTAGVRARGGLLVGAPDPMPASTVMSKVRVCIKGSLLASGQQARCVCLLS